MSAYTSRKQTATIRLEERIHMALQYFHPAREPGKIQHGALSDIVNLALAEYLKATYDIDVKNLPEKILNQGETQ